MYNLLNILNVIQCQIIFNNVYVFINDVPKEEEEEEIKRFCKINMKNVTLIKDFSFSLRKKKSSG